MPRTMTLEEALQEFESELERIAEDTRQMQERYDSGYWAMSKQYSSVSSL